MVDFLGREIHVGDTIVYPGRRGSSLWMNKAIVKDLYPAHQVTAGEWDEPLIVAHRPDNPRDVEIRNTHRVVVVA